MSPTLEGMSNSFDMPIADVLKDYPMDPEAVERIAHRKKTPALEVVPYDPAWETRFQELRDAIVSALGSFALSIDHTGSTSVRGLAAKPVIDIDMVVADVADEARYVPALAAAGFDFLFREPKWHHHRFFVTYGDPTCNLHVFGQRCPEVARHRVFREWLRRCDEDRQLYGRTKMEAAVESAKHGENVMGYNKRKNEVVQYILKRAFRDRGYLKDEDAGGQSAAQATKVT